MLGILGAAWYVIQRDEVKGSERDNAGVTISFTNRGPAMEPTFSDGDKLKGVIVRPQDIKRGDLIIFRPPSTSTERMVKRVVGLPGDTVAVKGGRIAVTTVQGEAYDPGLSGAPPAQSLTKSVTADSFFVVGDNLGNSLDSRAEAFGLVPFDNLLGLVER